MPKACEIIMVRYGLPELEKECVDSVLKHTVDVDYRFTDHDNYEADEGLAKVWNDLIRISDAEYICLLNNDTRVEAEWLSKILECFEEDDNLGAIGPMTNSSTGPQGNCRKYQTKEKRLIEAHYPLVGFCLVFPRDVWEAVGGFDEGYEIYGEDSDFCMEIQERGYITAIRTDVFIFHHGKSSQPIAEARGKNILALKKKSKERFVAKWHTPEKRAAAAKRKVAAAKRKADAAKRKADAAKRKEDAAEMKKNRAKPNSAQARAYNKRKKLAEMRRHGK